MPIYEYLCEECETRFEKIVINKQQEIACPNPVAAEAAAVAAAAATSARSQSWLCALTTLALC